MQFIELTSKEVKNLSLDEVKEKIKKEMTKARDLLKISEGKK